MTGALPPAGSPWLDGRPTRARAALEEDVEVDAAVVGAGITGLTAALLLARAGLSVAVVEADRVGGGVTGHTTAKLSALHGLVYDELRGRLGLDAAAGYGAGNSAALELIEDTIQREQIECDWRRAAAYTYAESADARRQVEAEVEAARAAGLAAEFVEDVPLPYPVSGAIKLADQAEFHPVRYVEGLARAAEAQGATIYERTRVRSTSKRPGRPSLKTEGGATVHADQVVFATLMPLPDRGLFFTRLTAQRSYSVAAPVSAPAGGMFISAGSPTRSIRSHPWKGGQELLVLSGEGHVSGENDETVERYKRLAAFAREHFGVAELSHRWSAHDLMPADGLPYAGPITPLSRSIWIAAGFRKWGLTNGTLCAMVLADRMLGRENPYADLLDSNRKDVHHQARGVAKEGAKDARHMADWLRPALRTENSLARGEGAIVRRHGRPVAAYRDPAGELHVVSAMCTHLGCRLAFNAAERSWDCPCHGSRFDIDGGVLQGPAVRPLKQKGSAGRG